MAAFKITDSTVSSALRAHRNAPAAFAAAIGPLLANTEPADWDPEAADYLAYEAAEITRNFENDNKSALALPVIQAMLDDAVAQLPISPKRQQYFASFALSNLAEQAALAERVIALYLAQPIDDPYYGLYIAIKLTRLGYTAKALEVIAQCLKRGMSLEALDTHDFAPAKKTLGAVALQKVMAEYEAAHAQKLLEEAAARAALTNPETTGTPADWWPELAGLLKAEPSALQRHWQPWARTETCQDLLGRVCAAFDSAAYDEDKAALVLRFNSDQADHIEVTLKPPYPTSQGLAALPRSYVDVVLLHNGVRIATGPAAHPELQGILGGNAFSEFPAHPRFQGFADAGQDFWCWDLKQTNALKEPLLVFIDHGGDVSDRVRLPGQNEPWGVSGLMLRAVAAAVFQNDAGLERFR